MEKRRIFVVSVNEEACLFSISSCDIISKEVVDHVLRYNIDVAGLAGVTNCWRADRLDVWCPVSMRSEILCSLDYDSARCSLDAKLRDILALKESAIKFLKHDMSIIQEALEQKQVIESLDSDIDRFPITGICPAHIPVIAASGSWLDKYYDGRSGCDKITNITQGKEYLVHQIEGYGDVFDVFVVDDNGEETRLSSFFFKQKRVDAPKTELAVNAG